MSWSSIQFLSFGDSFLNILCRLGVHARPTEMAKMVPWISLAILDAGRRASCDGIGPIDIMADVLCVFGVQRCEHRFIRGKQIDTEFGRSRMNMSDKSRWVRMVAFLIVLAVVFSAPFDRDRLLQADSPGPGRCIGGFP